jgi:hypothetical protein
MTERPKHRLLRPFLLAWHRLKCGCVDRSLRRKKRTTTTSTISRGQVWLKRSLFSALLAVVAWLVLPRDFSVYLSSAKALLLQQSPWDAATISVVAHQYGYMPEGMNSAGLWTLPIYRLCAAPPRWPGWSGLDVNDLQAAFGLSGFDVHRLLGGAWTALESCGGPVAGIGGDHGARICVQPQLAD